MKKVDRFEEILRSIDPCIFNEDMGEAIDRHCRDNGLPDDLAEAIVLYTEARANWKHWPKWMRKEYENQIAN